MRMSLILSLVLVVVALSVGAAGGYTNHAGNVIAGWPVGLAKTQVTLAERRVEDNAPYYDDLSLGVTNDVGRVRTYPLSIFPESEQRRIAADFGKPRLPVEVRRAIAGAEKAMARSRRRAEKGLCAKEESEAFRAKAKAALKTYLDKQVKDGVITPTERKSIGK